MCRAPFLITRPSELSAAAQRCLETPRLAVDVEGNGLHAYRSRLCTVQLGWREGSNMAVAVIDAIALGAHLAPLVPLLCAAGPVKVLHDLSFDARMLLEAGLPLERVSDTSVAARFLGEPETGLAALVQKRCGAVLAKELQDHDWAARPLAPRELDYLAGDVAHLLALDDQLRGDAEALGIAAEIALECDYKLASARAPALERPPHLRLKGYEALAPIERAIARRLCETRERLAEREDVPPFRIMPSALLLELARRRPRSAEQVRRSCGRHAAARWADEWSGAVRRGLDDGETPDESLERAAAPSDPIARAARRRLERELGRWRRERAAARGVDVQVITPGHCLEPIVTALLEPEPAERRAALAAVPGFGALRVVRYADELCALGESGALAADG